MPLTDDHDHDARRRATRHREVNTGVHWCPGPASAWTVAPGGVMPSRAPRPGKRRAPD